MTAEGYDARAAWTKEILGMAMAYPAEYVIRIFKGGYPRLNLDKEAMEGARICDVGCGDGRNLVVLKEVGFAPYATEITAEIVDKVRKNMDALGVRGAAIEVGTNERLPFQDGFFDYLLSRNACYYMGDSRDLGAYVREFARVLRPGGYLVLSIPKKSCFIYHGSERLAPGYQIIREDPFHVRNGEVLRMFEDEDDIAQSFAPDFTDFVFGSVEDDCFGYDYHWHLAVCRRVAPPRERARAACS